MDALAGGEGGEEGRGAGQGGEEGVFSPSPPSLFLHTMSFLSVCTLSTRKLDQNGGWRGGAEERGMEQDLPRGPPAAVRVRRCAHMYPFSYFIFLCSFKQACYIVSQCLLCISLSIFSLAFFPSHVCKIKPPRHPQRTAKWHNSSLRQKKKKKKKRR